MEQLVKTAPLRVGIIGCGHMAGVHAQAYSQNPSFKIVAACDINAGRLTTFAKTWRVPQTFSNPIKFATQAQLDVISICSPTKEHFRQTKLFLGYGSPRVIFVEKPVCETQLELKDLKKLSRQTDTIILVNHTRRFDLEHQRVRELIEKNTLGKLVQGHCSYYGGWLNNGSHLVDTLRMLLNSEPKIIVVSAGAAGRANDPCWNVQLSFGKARVNIYSFDEDFYQLFEIDLLFERGRILFRNFGQEIIVEQVEVNKIGERVLVPFNDSPWKGLASPLSHAVELINKSVYKGIDLSSTGTTIDCTELTMKVLWEVIKKGGHTV